MASLAFRNELVSRIVNLSRTSEIVALMDERMQAILDLLDPDLPCYEQDSNARIELLKEGLAFIESVRYAGAESAKPDLASRKCPPQAWIVL